MPMAPSSWKILGTLALGGLLSVPRVLAAAPGPDAAPLRPGVRVPAIAALSSGGAGSNPCLTPLVQSMRSEHPRGTAASRRAVATLAAESTLPGERLILDSESLAVRFTTDRGAADRIDALDDNANGRPDAVDETIAGASRAQHFLVGQLDLPNPGGIEFVLGRLGSGVDGVSIANPGRLARTHVWLDPSARAGSASLRRAAEHQYAHAVGAAAGLDPAWGEAFATWAGLALEGSPDDRTLAALSSRVATQGAGLVTQDTDLAAGNALWFAFLNEAYGPTAVKLVVEELGRGVSDQAALDRAIRRATGRPLDAALRDYQLWSTLTGSRDDRHHFAFASRLPSPVFASTAENFPDLSVQSDPEIGPMGFAAVLLRPDELAGGLTVRFEGDLAARWAADVLVVGAGGQLRRVPVTLDPDDAGEISIPVQDTREILLLVRNLDAEGRPSRRYSWAAHFEPGFPVEFGMVRAEPADARGGALVSWDTATERGLLGFNVWRARSDRGPETKVNPVWIPSVGESAGPAAYSFFDAEAERGVSYRYRVEAVTLEGLASRSDAATLVAAP